MTIPPPASGPAGTPLDVLAAPLDGERRHVTVLFADLSGFTALSERLDAEEIAALTNACFQVLVEVVLRYEGIIDKYIGDEIMALFGVPRAHENDAERAVRAALEMHEALASLTTRMTSLLPTPLTLHCGINSGEVIAGLMGSERRLDYSVVGDTVNLAARLVAAAPPGEIYVSERTAAQSRHAVAYRTLRPFKVKGKQHRVQAYQAQGLREVPAPRRGAPDGASPFVGRAAELDALLQALDTARAGQGCVVGIVGDAGIGKSRLLAEVQAQAGDFSLGTAACLDYETPPPYQLFADLWRGLLGLARDEHEQVVRVRVEDWVVSMGLDPHTVAPYLGSLFTLRAGSTLLRSDEERAEGVHAALLAALRALAARRPLLLVLEDLHWIDPLSRALLDRLVAEAATLPLLLCCAYRPEFSHAWAASPSYTEHLLAPLSTAQAAALSQALLRVTLPPELDRLIVERCEGNPFYIEEMLKALIDEGVLARAGNGYALTRPLASLSLPDTIQGVLVARIDRLESQAREALQYAAVIGRRFPQNLLAAVAPRPQEVSASLHTLQTLQLVYQHAIVPELEYIFKHVVLQDVVYRGILSRQRAAMHLAIATQMEALYRDRVEDYAEALAHHFAAGEDWARAADYYGRAGRKARDLYSDAAAATFLDKRAQAVEKLVERPQGAPRARQVELGLNAAATVVSIMILLGARFDGSETAGLIAAALFLPLLWAIFNTLALAVQFRRARAAEIVTVYADRLSIRSRKRLIEVPFTTIVALHGSSQRRGWWRDRSFTHRWFWLGGAQLVYGTSRFDTLSRARYLRLNTRLRLTRRGAPPLILDALDVAQVYRDLQVALSRWAATTEAPLPSIQGQWSPLALREALPLRRADGVRRGMTTYAGLIEGVERGHLGPMDMVALQTAPSAEDEWTTLRDAARADSRLWVALYPLRYSLHRLLRGPLLWLAALPIVEAPLLLALGALLSPVLAYGAVIVWLPLLLRYPLWGVLEWTRRFALPFWQRIGLLVAARVVGGLAVPFALLSVGFGIMQVPYSLGTLAFFPSGPIAVASSGGRVIVSTREDTVTVLDSRTAARVSFISLGRKPLGATSAGAVAVDEVTGRAFVLVTDPSAASDTVTLRGSVAVLDARSGALQRTTPVGGYPQVIAVAPLTARVFVANWDSVFISPPRTAPPNTISMLDARSGTVLRTVRVGLHTSALAVTRHSQRLVAVGLPDPSAPDQHTGTLSLLDARSGALLHTVAVHGLIWGAQTLAVDERDDHIFLAAQAGIGIFDARSGARLAQIPLPAAPSALVFDERARHLFAAVGATVRVLDARGMPLLPALTTGMDISTLGLDSRAGRLLAVGDISGAPITTCTSIFLSSGCGSGPSQTPVITIFDARGGALVRRVTLGRPRLRSAPAITVDEITERAFITDQQDGTVSVFDTRTGTRVATVPVR